MYVGNNVSSKIFQCRIIAQFNLFFRDMQNWTTEQVAHWLQESSLPGYIIDTFRENDIDGEVLASEFMSSENLKHELGIEAFGIRCKILDRIKKLKESEANFPLALVRSSPRTMIESTRMEMTPGEEVQRLKPESTELQLVKTSTGKTNSNLKSLPKSQNHESLLAAKEKEDENNFEIDENCEPSSNSIALYSGGGKSKYALSQRDPERRKSNEMKTPTSSSSSARLNSNNAGGSGKSNSNSKNSNGKKKVAKSPPMSLPPLDFVEEEEDDDESYSPSSSDSKPKSTPSQKRSLDASSSNNNNKDEDSAKKKRYSDGKLTYAQHCELLNRNILEPEDLAYDEEVFRTVYKWLRDPKQDLSLEDKIKLYLNLYFDVTLQESLDPVLQAGLQHLLIAKVRMMPDFRCIMLRDIMPPQDYKMFGMRGAIPETLLSNLGISAFFTSNYPGRAMMGTFSAKHLTSALENLSPEAEQKYHNMNKTIEKYLLRMKQQQ